MKRIFQYNKKKCRKLFNWRTIQGTDGRILEKPKLFGMVLVTWKLLSRHSLEHLSLSLSLFLPHASVAQTKLVNGIILPCWNFYFHDNFLILFASLSKSFDRSALHFFVIQFIQVHFYCLSNSYCQFFVLW